MSDPVSEGLRAGDRVIDLSALARTAGAISGAATGVTVAWLAGAHALSGAALAIVGGAGGVALGWSVGRLRYVLDHRHLVVKGGPGSLPAASNAALSAAVPAAILVWLGSLTVLGGPAPSLATGMAALLVGVATGLLVGRAASRL